MLQDLSSCRGPCFGRLFKSLDRMKFRLHLFGYGLRSRFAELWAVMLDSDMMKRTAKVGTMLQTSHMGDIRFRNVNQKQPAVGFITEHPLTCAHSSSCFEVIM